MKPEQPETMTSKDEVPNSKSEIRNPKQIQSTKSEQEETERTEKEGPSLFPLLTPVLSARSRISSLAPGGSTGPKDESRIMQALQEYRTAREAGTIPDRREFLGGHAEIANELAPCLDALDFVYEAAPKFQDSELGPGSAPDPAEPANPITGTLGDFRIIREVGRGGMGVVYEAEQISLGRRVALKVLPFATTLDAKQLQRFKNEAHAAAHLHHNNIVPVYATGCERGVHFYAMQFIEGQTLAALIQELRQVEGRDGEARREPRRPESLASELVSGRWAPAQQRAADSLPTGPYMPSAPVDQTLGPITATPPVGALSTEHSTSRPVFFRTVANLGIQAAEGLEHAHQLGVIHRDIKPANLMVDARSNLWITDFGLAHCQGGCELTMSGDLLGTLRYMSPEQAMGNRVIVDQRTDIYSLGVTLYELLTLEPAFPGTDRQDVLRQIAFDDPKPPRRLNKAIPAELETIVLKAMEKNPADRYATAQELADDLERYLKNEPIRARRPSVRQRTVKWVRRHKAVSWMAVAALVVVAVGSTISALIIAHQWNLAEQRRQDADHERRAARQAEKRANDERDRAKRSEEQAEAINQFLVKNILTFSSPGRFGYRESDTTVAQALEEASRSVETAFPGQPELEASVRLTIGNTYFLLGRFKEAEQHLRRGLDLRGDLLSDSADPWGREYAETAFATKRLGLALQELGRKEEAKPFLLRGGEARRRIEIRRIPLKVNAFPFTLHPLKVVFSPDGRWLLASGDDGFHRLYDVATGMEIHRFVAHTRLDPVGLAFSPDGRHALSGGDDATARLWDVYTAKELRQFTGHTDRVHLVAFSPDGRHVLTASNDKTLRLWDAQSGKEERQFLGHTDLIYASAFSPDGRWVLSASKDETMRLWEVGTGAEIRCFPKARPAVGPAVFSPDGRQALSTNDDGLHLWDVETGEELRRFPDAAGLGVSVTPDGHHAVISGDARGKWYLWDLDTGKELRSYYVEPPLRPKGIEVSSDGRLAVCGNWRGSISIWRMGDPPAFGQELAEAGRYYDQKRREFGPDAPETLQALDELAALHLDRGEPADAEPFFRQSLEHKQRILGAEHPATLAAMKNLAHVLKEQKKLTEAVTLLRQCLEIYRRVQGPEHADILVGMNDLADAFEDQGKRDEADVLYRQCLEGCHRLLGEYHPETQAAARKLVSKLQAHGKPLEPELLGPATGYVFAEMGQWDKALTGLAKVFELELPKADDLWLDYACLLVHQGDTQGYRKLCGRLLERFHQSKNEDEIPFLTHVLVLVPQELPDVGSILELAERRMAKARSGGPLYSNRFWSAHVLGLTYYRAGRYEEAAVCLSEFLNDHYGEEHDVANWLLMAMTEQRLGHDPKAQNWFDKAQQWIKEKTPNPDQEGNFPAPRGHRWPYWFIIQSLHGEAEALMHSKTADQAAQKKSDKPATEAQKP